MNRIVGNLPLWQKFALIGAISMCALVPPFWLVTKSHIGELDAATNELSGVAPAGGVIALLRATQTHREIGARWLAGDDAAKGAREVARTQVEQAFAKARAGAAAMHESKLDTRLDAAQRLWQTLDADVGARKIDEAAAIAQHGALIAEQLAALETITDDSGLILDPEASSYHVVSSALATLPHLIESTGVARVRGAMAIAGRPTQADDRLALGAASGSARQQLATTRRELDKSIAADPALGQALSQPLAAAVDATDAAFKLVSRLVAAGGEPLDGGVFGAAMNKALDAQYALADAALKSLDEVLSARAAVKRNELIAVSAIVAGFALLTVAVIVLVTRSTLRSVRAATDAANALAAGDLTLSPSVHTRDELGQLLHALRSSTQTLARVVGGIQQTSESVSSAATQIAQGNLDLSERTEQQASNLQQTAASMDELNATVHNNAETAGEAAQMARSASEVAAEGGQAVGRVVATMNEITRNSNKIGEIIGVIDAIAFQTNLLALNAAVEAARAGEQGRGFAVVAGEVRSLAGRASQAAKEIKQLIGESVEKVQTGSRQVDDAGRTMQSIVAQVGRVTQMIAAISHATSEQTTGIGQVNAAVNQLDEMTQQNAALVEQSAAAAASLQQQAGQLVASVSMFRLGADGVGAAPARA